MGVNLVFHSILWVETKTIFSAFGAMLAGTVIVVEVANAFFFFASTVRFH